MISRPQLTALLNARVAKIAADRTAERASRIFAKQLLRQIKQGEANAELARRGEALRQAEAKRLADEYEAKRFQPFEPETPPPVSGRRRAKVIVLDAGDHEPEAEPERDEVFALGDDD